MKAFDSKIKCRVAIEKVVLYDKTNFNDCSITQAINENIEMSVKDYLSAIKPAVRDHISKDQLESVSKNEAQDYRRLAGELIWIDSEALPQAGYIESVFSSAFQS